MSQAVLSIGAILAAERLFVHLTHALQIQTHGALPAAAAAQTAAVNHEYLVIGMLLGAIVGMISSFGVTEATAMGQFKTMLFIPLPMVGALAFGIAIGGHRVLALTSLAVVLSVGTYLRRFGPRGFLAGLLLFMGDFFGFFLHSAVKMSDLGVDQSRRGARPLCFDNQQRNDWFVSQRRCEAATAFSVSDLDDYRDEGQCSEDSDVAVAEPQHGTLRVSRIRLKALASMANWWDWVA